MWDLPRPGLEPVSRALAGRLSTTAPPGKPSLSFLPSNVSCTWWCHLRPPLLWKVETRGGGTCINHVTAGCCVLSRRLSVLGGGPERRTLEQAEGRRERRKSERERRGRHALHLGCKWGGDACTVDFRVGLLAWNVDKNGHLQMLSLLPNSPVTCLSSACCQPAHTLLGAYLLLTALFFKKID